MSASDGHLPAAAAAACKSLVDDMFRTVRSLALGLRPSMLDDCGLQAALEWHVRDFTHRYDIDVDLRMEGDFEALPEQHRTCVYRAVQEAMTNAVRHGHPRTIRIAVAQAGDALHLRVTDDGVGLDPGRRRQGLGLRGIEERVRELHGTSGIVREPSGGTTLSLQLPIPRPAPEVPLARAAG
jgi:signal transduction histidine kinase